MQAMERHGKEKSSEKGKSKSPLDNITNGRDAVKRDDSAWENDQKKKSYYYDDAHGYEIYNPDEDGDEEQRQ